MQKRLKPILDLLKITLGCALFGLGFNLFLAPNALNAGGLCGLAMTLVELTRFGSVGIITAVLNLPLFAIGGRKIGKHFFFGSLIGIGLSSLFLDLFTALPKV